MKLTTSVKLTQQDLENLNKMSADFGVSKTELLRLGFKKLTDKDINDLKANKQLIGV